MTRRDSGAVAGVYLPALFVVPTDTPGFTYTPIDMEIISPSVSSATATALAPGVFMTTMPLWVAASVSMLSTPTPARPITRCSTGPGGRARSSATSRPTT